MPHPLTLILGAGPAGCTLAALLARKRYPVVVFDDGRRPPLLVGESMLPAMVPILRDLELEERVAAISRYKPGASFFQRDGLEMHFSFQSVEGMLPPYSYNVPRPQFDDLLRQRAIELGARFVSHRVRLTPRPGDPDAELRVDDAALEAAGVSGSGAQPFLVDATGRARASARVLGISAREGPRRDQAHFAHFEGFEHPYPDGQIAITYHSFGWSWRIPLRDRMSFGVVMNAEHAPRWGSTPGERLRRVQAEDPRLSPLTRDAKAVTEPATYSNYQLISDRAWGPGWAAIGDAFGFVDPMLSPGVFMGMKSAGSLAAILTSPDARNGRPDPARLRRHEAEVRHWLTAWQELISYFYDGQIAALFLSGQDMKRRHPGRISNFMEWSMTRRLARMASGATTASWWNRSVVRQSVRWLTDAQGAKPFALP